jgi:hypothetical protein
VKAAAFGEQCAVSLRGISLEFSIDLPDTGYGVLGIATRVGSLVGIAFAHEREKLRAMKDE